MSTIHPTVLRAVCAVWIAGFPLPAIAAQFGELVKSFDNPHPSTDSYFGSGTTLFNGNILTAGWGITPGVYLIDVNTGAQILKLNSPDPDEISVSFGGSLLQAGQRIVVGDYNANISPQVRVGSVYIFDGATGNLLRTIRNPQPETFSYFGTDLEYVAGKLLVSANSPSGGYLGQVHVYDPDTGQQLQTIQNPESTGYGFGSTLQRYGNDVFIATLGTTVPLWPDNSRGVVYRYDGTTLAPKLKISDPVAQDTRFFGWDMDANDSQLLVSARDYSSSDYLSVGRAYLFDANTGALLRTFENPEPEDYGDFGDSVALFGHYAAISSPTTHEVPGSGGLEAGAVYLFDTISGEYLGRIFNPFPIESPWFGSAGILSEENLLIVPHPYGYVDGYSNGGSVFIFSVPEPSTETLGIVALACCGVVVAGRRKSHGRCR